MTAALWLAGVLAIYACEATAAFLAVRPRHPRRITPIRHAARLMEA